MPDWLAEPAITGFQQQAEIIRLVDRRTSSFQRIEVYDTVPFGRTLVLDGAIQTTLEDEFTYHEMLVHPALTAHAAPKEVLVIGGGDGGALRRVLQHHQVNHATMVEIDGAVVDVCAQFLPEIAADAFRDSRANLIIGDGVRFVHETQRQFDVVLIDSTDPVGAAQALFSNDFYNDVYRILRPDGLLVTQSGSPLLMQTELMRAAGSLRSVFPFVSCYLANIPAYPGCLWSFLVGVRHETVANRFSPDASDYVRADLANRFSQAAIETRYYNPAVHFAALALPTFLSKALESSAAA